MVFCKTSKFVLNFVPFTTQFYKGSHRILKTDLGNQDRFFETYHHGVCFLKQFLHFAGYFGLPVSLDAHILYFCKFCPICKDFTAFCKTRIIVIKSLSTLQWNLTQCNISFHDMAKFEMKLEFELLQEKIGVSFAIKCPLCNGYFQKLPFEWKEGVGWQILFALYLSNHFLNNLQ